MVFYTKRDTKWNGEQDARLTGLIIAGKSYSEAAAALNSEFGTAYSRNATIGRGKRIGLVGAGRPDSLPSTRQARAKGAYMTNANRIPRPKCVAVATPPRPPAAPPRLIALVELEANDCRWPIGGWPAQTPVLFCGVRQCVGPYCFDHAMASAGTPR
jgi:GcrA cell cycle regulator